MLNELRYHVVNHEMNEGGGSGRRECLNLQMVFELRMHPNREYQ